MPTRRERTITKIKLCGIKTLVEKKIRENETTKISRPVLLHLDRPGGWGVQVGVELLLRGLHRQLHRQHRHHRQLWVSASFLKCNSNVIILWILQFVHKSGWDGSDGWCLHNNWPLIWSQCFRVLSGHINYSYQLHFVLQWIHSTEIETKKMWATWWQRKDKSFPLDIVLKWPGNVWY